MASVTTTAAPKTKAVALIKVINADTGKPLPNARVEIHSIGTGKSTAAGTWTSAQFLPGSYDVKVFLSGFGPEPPPGLPRAEWTWIKNVTFGAVTAKVPRTTVEVKLFQALPRAAIKVTNGKDGTPVFGALVSGGGQFSDKTDKTGQIVTKGIQVGSYPVTAKKPGWGPLGAPKAGDVVKWTWFSGTANVPVDLVMVPIWGKVKSSKITVSGKNFVDWFNTDFIPRFPKTHPTIIYPEKTPAKTFPNKVNQGAFANIFDHCDEIYAPELTVEEFVAIFLIMYNESGFVPRQEADYLHSERATLKYCFENKKKSSYNVPPNFKAGDQLTDPEQFPCQILTDAGITLTEAQKTAWNGQSKYPDPDPATSPELFRAAKECDFYKFRGRGIIQITWRNNFERCVDPHLAAVGFASSSELTEEKLAEAVATNKIVYRRMVRSFLKPMSSYTNVNGQSWWQFGKDVSGGDNYANIFEYRCKSLVAELQKEEVVLA